MSGLLDPSKLPGALVYAVLFLGTAAIVARVTTTGRGDDGRQVIVPNSTMATQVTVNLNDVQAT